MPHKLIAWIPEEPFIDFTPVNEPVNAKEPDAHLNACVLGDLHSSYYSLIQQLIVEQVISLPKEDLTILSQMTQSTYLDQVEPLLKAYSSISQKINELEEILAASEEVPAATKRGIEKRMFFQRSLLKQKELLFQTLKTAITKELQVFKETLQHMQIVDLEKLIILIGDELADRGNCDLKMLLLLSELKKRGVNIHTLLSNHAVELLCSHLTGRWKRDDLLFVLGDPISDPTQSQSRSLKNLKILRELRILSATESDELIESWVGSLHLLTASYSEEKNSFTLYTHAPVGLETIIALAEKYNIPYNDATPKMLCETINQIDAHFQKSLQIDALTIIKQSATKYGITYQNETLRDLYEISNSLKQKDIASFELIKKSFLYHFLDELAQADTPNGYQLNIDGSGKLFPLLSILWNRERMFLASDKTHANGYTCYFCNGHDTAEDEEEALDNRFELNHDWGKPFFPCQVFYTYFPVSLNFVKINDTNSLVAYHIFSTRGTVVSGNQVSMRSNLPGHHFRGVVQIPSFDVNDKNAVNKSGDLIKQRVQEEMNKTPILTVLYECDYETMRYLKIKDECFSFALTAMSKNTASVEQGSPKTITCTPSLNTEPFYANGAANGTLLFKPDISGLLSEIKSFNMATLKRSGF